MGKVLLVAAVLAGTGVAAAREPSEACRTGEVAPVTTPAGVGARQAGDPYQEPTSLYVCSTVLAPGAAWVRADTPGDRTHVIVDGDERNQVTPCADGYTAVRADTDGTVRLYHADDGDFTFLARDRAAHDWAVASTACHLPSPS